MLLLSWAPRSTRTEDGLSYLNRRLPHHDREQMMRLEKTLSNTALQLRSSQHPLAKTVGRLACRLGETGQPSRLSLGCFQSRRHAKILMKRFRIRRKHPTDRDDGAVRGKGHSPYDRLHVHSYLMMLVMFQTLVCTGKLHGRCGPAITARTQNGEEA